MLDGFVRPYIIKPEYIPVTDARPCVDVHLFNTLGASSWRDFQVEPVHLVEKRRFARIRPAHHCNAHSYGLHLFHALDTPQELFPVFLDNLSVLITAGMVVEVLVSTKGLSIRLHFFHFVPQLFHLLE